MRLHRRLCAAIVIGIAICGVAAVAQVPTGDPAWTAPPAAAAKANPLASRPDAERGGRKLFAARCATCHGDGGRGTDKGPDLTATDVQAQSDGALFWKITSGNSRAGMPTFSFLPDAQRWQIVLRLRSLASEPRNVPPSTDAHRESGRLLVGMSPACPSTVEIAPPPLSCTYHDPFGGWKTA